MSFAESLHDCFELVNNHSTQRRKGAAEFIQLMEEKVLVEETYAKGLERIGSNPFFVTTQGTLAHAVLAMKNDSLNRAMQARILVENITNDLINPLKELMNNQLKTLQKTCPEGKRVEKEKAAHLEKFYRFKNRYFKACKEAEGMAYVLESPQPAQKREKMMQKLVQLRQEIEESLKGYKDSVVSHNEFKDKYTDFMSKILEVYQKQEEQRLETMKDCLRKLVIYETSYLRNLQYDIDNLAKAMESVNIKSDIKQFVDENASSSIKNSKLEFEPFEGSHESFKNLGGQAPVVSVPATPIQVIFSEISNQTSIIEILKGEISMILNKAWEGVSLTNGELAYFTSASKEGFGRKTILLCLNSQKTSARCQLTQAAYTEISRLFDQFLTECDQSNDIFSLKACITLLQSFQLEETKKPLQDNLLGHSIWKRLDIWDNIIQIAINEEIKAHEQYISESEAKEDKEKRIKNTVFCQLGSFAYVIDGYGVEKRYTAEIIAKYACKYELSSADMDTLMASICVKEIKPVESPQEVIRGIPAWLQELEGAASAINRRNSQKKEIPAEPLPSSEDQ